MAEETGMSQEMVIGRLKERGFRITKQRKLIISTILENECSCCKEIYYQVHEKDHTVGIATVYRMIKTLEEAEIIDRRNMYRIGELKEAD